TTRPVLRGQDVHSTSSRQERRRPVRDEALIYWIGAAGTHLVAFTPAEREIAGSRVIAAGGTRQKSVRLKLRRGAARVPHARHPVSRESYRVPGLGGVTHAATAALSAAMPLARVCGRVGQLDVMRFWRRRRLVRCRAGGAGRAGAGARAAAGGSRRSRPAHRRSLSAGVPAAAWRPAAGFPGCAAP